MTALDLRDNVNLWGAPPSARRVLRAFGADRLASYPAVDAAPVAATLAAWIGVADDEVVLGCGSDGVLDAAFRALGRPGEAIAFSDPTFSMVPRFAHLAGLALAPVPALPSGEADIEGLLATRAPLIYLCSPNNPTGVVTPEARVHELIARAPGRVIVDEAYAEFAGTRDWRREIPRLGNVLLVRTFSKAWGLAGLRVGYGLGARDLVAATAWARGPYSVSAVAEAVVSSALMADEEWQRRTTRAAVAARDRLAARLTKRLAHRRDIRVWPSRANFVFLSLADDAAVVAGRFAERGVGVRAFRGLTGIGDALRIGMAPWPRLRGVADVAVELLG